MKKETDVTWKDASPLTLADSASPDFLVESIRSLTPGVPHNFRGIRRRSRGVDRSRQMVLVGGLMSRNCLEHAARKSGAEWCTALWLQLFATMRCFELV
jgi:hypothetical protein